MRKILSKVTHVILGLVLALGVGTAISVKHVESNPVLAAETEYSFQTSVPSGWTASPARNTSASENTGRGSAWQTSATLTFNNTETISSVVIVLSTNKTVNSCSVSVGGNSYGTHNLSKANYATETFTGSSSGNIVISLSRSEGTIYIQTVTVITGSGGGSSFTPDHAGTEADPYSVADARGLIDAQTTASGKYATGIVSEIVTAYSSQYKNITFNFKDNASDNVYLQAYRCGGNDAANVQVGDTVVVSGNLKKHNTTYEFDSGCSIVSLVHPTVETSYTVSFDANGGTTPAAKEVGEGLTFVFPEPGSVSNKIFKGWSSDNEATFFQAGSTSPVVNADITYTAYWSEKGTVSNPYTIAEAKTAIDGNYGLVDAHVSGKVSQVDSFNSTYSSITYWVSDDGTTSNQLEVYSGKGLNGAAFSSVDDVVVGASAVVKGTLKKHNDIYEFDKNNQLVSYTEPVPAEVVSIAFSGTMTKTSYTTLEAWDTTGLVVTATYDNEDTADVTSSVAWSFYDTNDVEKATPSIFGEATDATLKIKATYSGFECTTTATVNVEAVEFNGYIKVTSTAGLVVGDSYVLGVENNTKGCELMGNQGNNIRERVDASAAFNEARTQITASGVETAGAVVVTLLSNGEGKYAFYDITNNKYIHGASTTSNQIYSADTLADAGANAWWEISFSEDLMDVTLSGTTRVLAYNLGSPRFATYNSYAANSTTVTNGNAHPVLFRMEGSSVITSATTFANNSLKMNDSAYEGDIVTEHCAENYAAMKLAYADLSDAVKNIFQFSSLFGAARARLVNWAKANGEEFVYGSATPFVLGANTSISYNSNSNASTIIIVVVALTSITSIGVLLVIKRKRSLVK